MRRVLQQVVLLVRLALLDLADLLANREHRVAETVELGLGLALGRLDHQGASHGEGDRGRMEAVVDQPLRDVLHLHAGRRLEAARLYDALVRDQAVLAGVYQAELARQPLGDVIGVQDRDLGRVGQSVAAHHRDVGPRDRQDRGTAPGRARHGAAGLLYAQRYDRMIGQVRRQMRRDTDRPHAGTAAAVRDAKGLVEVEVAHVGADVTRPAQSDLRVHVGAVHVHLAAVLVHDAAHLFDRILEHAVRGRIRHHQRAQVLGVLGRLGAEIVQVDVAVGRRLHRDHLEARHHRARRIGAVRRHRDEADCAVAFAPRHLVRANHQQARELALRAGVGLQ